jgi:hypothetical protein
MEAGSLTWILEPRFIELSKVLQICDAVAAGRIEVMAYGFLGRLVGCDVGFQDETTLPTVTQGGVLLRLLATFGVIRKVRLPYEPW